MRLNKWERVGKGVLTTGTCTGSHSFSCWCQVHDREISRNPPSDYQRKLAGFSLTSQQNCEYQLMGSSTSPRLILCCVREALILLAGFVSGSGDYAAYGDSIYHEILRCSGTASYVGCRDRGTSGF